MLTEQQKLDFIRDGYIILRGIIPEEKLITVRKHVNKAFRQKKYTPKSEPPVAITFQPEVQRSPVLFELPNNTQIIDALNDLLGEDNYTWGKGVQVAFRLQHERKIRNGFGITDNMRKKAYHVDGGEGRYRHNGTAFTILLGVALSRGQMKDENRGQLNVWPGSHVLLHDIIKERVNAGLVDGHKTLYGDEGKKPDIGDPIRVRMRPGDVVLAHQRLGHSGGINMSDVVRKNIYFRVKHVRHDELLEEQWSGSLWTAFEGLHDLVGYQAK